MAKKDEPTQWTKPEKGEPVEIPVPKRGDIMRIFDRAAQPLPDKPKSRRRKRSAGK
jgi:hypothetical protein